MELEKYKKIEKVIENEYKAKLHQLRMEYAQNYSNIKIGDFVFNVTGIIKVESIRYDMCMGVPEPIYYGYRYKKVKGQLLRTKDPNISFLRSNVKILT